MLRFKMAECSLNEYHRKELKKGKKAHRERKPAELKGVFIVTKGQTRDLSTGNKETKSANKKPHSPVLSSLDPGHIMLHK
jgi:hypothetical protein